MMRRALAAIRTAVAKFRRSERGNVAMMFAAASIPLVLASGGMVDFARIYYAKTDLQDALDATALALSKTAPTTPTAQLPADAQQVFAANFHDTDVEGLSLDPSYSSVGPTLTVTGNLNVHMYFMGLIGMNQVPVSASSTVVWGETRLRVALVLDNTGSMAQSGKMTALKAATHALLTQLQTAAQKPGDVYVSIIPFSRDVSVDPVSFPMTNDLSWAYWDANYGTCSNSKYTSQASCTMANKTWTPTPHNTWTGCITDREKDPNVNYDTLNTVPSMTVPATLFPADRYASCPTLMMGLSANWTALNARVDQMQPNGNTNQAIGLAWGWQSLTAAPFTIPPKDPGVDYRTVIILLSDGLNTQDRWFTNQNSIDARQASLCGNVHSAGIDMYTVQVDTGGDPTSTLLQQCASDPSQFFLLTSASGIVSTFQQIGTQLSQLRVSS
jgi:Flp pilus assembly protein TadG